MVDSFGFLAAFKVIWCSPGIVFLFPTWIFLAALIKKPVLTCASFRCKREKEVLGVEAVAAPESCAVLCRAAMGSSAPLSHAQEEGRKDMVCTLELNFLALVPVLLLGL